jgi:hypothetical protein
LEIESIDQQHWMVHAVQLSVLMAAALRRKTRASPCPLMIVLIWSALDRVRFIQMRERGGAKRPPPITNL